MVDDLAKSGITAQRAHKLGWYPVSCGQAEAILGMRLPAGTSDGYAIPYTDPVTGQPMLTAKGRPFIRVKFRIPPFTDPATGKTSGKYLSPKHGGIAPYILPEVAARVRAYPTKAVLITEGEKKAACATVLGVPVIGIGGIWNWKAGKGVEAVDRELAPYLTRRRTIMIYDSDGSDSTKKWDFVKCARAFAAALLPLCSTLEVIYLPNLVDDGKTGLDDFLMHPGGGAEKLRSILMEHRPTVEPGRLEVMLPSGSVDVIHTAAKLAELIAPHRRIFTRAGSGIVVALTDEDGAVRLRELRPATAVSEFELYANFFRWTRVKGELETESANASEQTARAILAAGEFTRRLPPIREVLDYPVPIRLPNGSIGTARRGYDPRMQTYTPHDSPQPERFASHQEALIALGEILGGFCFGESPKPDIDLFPLSALAYLLTSHCRMLYTPERAPVFYFEANRQGSGKDYLAGTAVVVTTGGEPTYYAPVDDSEETRKRIFAVCLGGERFFLTANAKGSFSNQSYEAATTAPMYSDRKLGVSENFELPNRAIYALSGNDLQLSEDMARRVIRIRLEFFGESVEKRTFQFPDLYARIRANRARYIGALQALVDHWIAAGCPEGTKLKPSFTLWSKVIGGILEACDLDNPIGEDVLTTTPTRDVQQFHLLLGAWRDTHGYGQLDSHGIRELAVANELFGYLGDLAADRSVQTRFGRLVTRYEKRVFGGLRIARAGEGKRPTWTLEVDSGAA